MNDLSSCITGVDGWGMFNVLWCRTSLFDVANKIQLHIFFFFWDLMFVTYFTKKRAPPMFGRKSSITKIKKLKKTNDDNGGELELDLKGTNNDDRVEREAIIRIINSIPRHNH